MPRTDARVEDRYVAVIFSGQRPHRPDQSFDSWVGPRDAVLETAVRLTKEYNANQRSKLSKKRYVVLVGKLEEIHTIVEPKPGIKVKVTKLDRLAKLVQLPPKPDMAMSAGVVRYKPIGKYGPEDY